MTPPSSPEDLSERLCEVFASARREVRRAEVLLAARRLLEDSSLMISRCASCAMGSWVTGSYLISGGPGIASIAAGPDLRMWFTENETSKVGSITVVGRVNQIYDTGRYPFRITVGPDGKHVVLRWLRQHDLPGAPPVARKRLVGVGHRTRS